MAVAVAVAVNVVAVDVVAVNAVTVTVAVNLAVNSISLSISFLASPKRSCHSFFLLLLSMLSMWLLSMRLLSRNKAI